MAPRSSDVEIRQRMQHRRPRRHTDTGRPGSDQCCKGIDPSPVRQAVVDPVDRRRRSCRGATPSTSSPDRPDSTRPYWPPRPRSIRVTRIYFDLPDDFPDDAAALAKEVTAGAANSYDAALLLQNWFRSEFAYSLEVQQGHSNDAIEGFLRDKVGYCEQFAGTYAAMMRSLGIPARVGGRVHHRETDRRRDVLRDRSQRSRMAGSVVRRSGLGAVRTHPWPWCIGGTELHGRGSGAGHLDRHPAGRRAAHPRRGGGRSRQHRADHAAPDSGGRRPRRRRSQRHRPTRPEQHRTALATRGSRWHSSPRSLSPWPRHRSGDGSAGVRGGRRANSWRTTGIGRSMPCVSSTCRSLHRPRRPKRRSSRSGLFRSCRDRCVRSPTRSRSPRMPRTGRSTSTTSGAYGASTVRDASHWARQIERAVNDSVPKRVRVYRYFTNWK